MKKLSCILLIDDNEADNFLHTRTINKANCTERVAAVQSGEAALDYLQSDDRINHPKPDLIFLDINMPGMNGWEFLEEYKELDKAHQAKIVVVMLTTSLNPDDEGMSKTLDVTADFKSKPLTQEMLEEVLEMNF